MSRCVLDSVPCRRIFVAGIKVCSVRTRGRRGRHTRVRRGPSSFSTPLVVYIPSPPTCSSFLCQTNFSHTLPFANTVLSTYSIHILLYTPLSHCRPTLISHTLYASALLSVCIGRGTARLFERFFSNTSLQNADGRVWQQMGMVSHSSKSSCKPLGFGGC